MRFWKLTGDAHTDAMIAQLVEVSSGLESMIVSDEHKNKIRTKLNSIRLICNKYYQKGH